MRIPIGAVEFDNVTMSEAVDWIVAMARKRDKPRLVCTGNLDHLATLQQDAGFRAIYQQADLVLADGMPVVWLSRLGRHGRLKERVAGSDLLWELGRVSASVGLRLFYLGGAPGSADSAAEAICRRYPGAQICGTYCPSFEEFGTEAEDARIEAAIRAANPDVLLVGLGAPKQEKWIIATRERMRVPVNIGVGGSFEMAAGIVRRAPRWMQRIGMEWAYRLLQEPRRMWRRYICRDLSFLVRLLFSMVASRKAPSGSGSILP